MWRGLLKLTWLEIKIFMREPLGALGTVLIPVLMFVGLGRLAGSEVIHVDHLAEALQFRML